MINGFPTLPANPEASTRKIKLMAPFNSHGYGSSLSL